jgi:hypothetical protein
MKTIKYAEKRFLYKDFSIDISALLFHIQLENNVKTNEGAFSTDPLLLGFGLCA